MPAWVLKCQACQRSQSFLIHADELADTEKKVPIERYCRVCHKTTKWSTAFPERRRGHERRTGIDRRAHP